MFKKNSQVKNRAESALSSEESVPKFQRPKILLIDLEEDSKKTLEKEGYNFACGTFGTPYKVQKRSDYVPVIVKAALPNFTEQEIIVLDLLPGTPTDTPPAEKMTPMQELDWWVSSSEGIVDPRPRAMLMVQDRFDRIFQNGGAFIIFSDNRNEQEIAYARSHGGVYGLSIEQEIRCSNWGFLTILSNLRIADDFGEEITPVENDEPLTRLLAAHLNGASFCCTFEAEWNIEEQWGVLARNKYAAAVAGFIRPPEKSKDGWIFVLPRISDRGAFLAAFFKNVLPDLCPALFPHAEGQRWVHRPIYEVPSVIHKVKEISSIQDAAANRIIELEKAIAVERSANIFLYDLLRETGANLVMAVQKALKILGFTAIVDVDAEMKKAGKEASLREDLRIHDISPVLVVDIKGVAGKPSDPEALQAPKHAFIYIQEQNRSDVRGLTIINHQRLLPPLDRDNEMPFRQEILDNAVQLKLGLMTTWDLFRLVRGFCNHSWTTDHVKPIFYKTGRILPIPCHYDYVGYVKHVWKNAFSVQIENGTLNVGDRIAIEFPVDFEEQAVVSLRLNDLPVLSANGGDEAGISRNEGSNKVKAGFSLYVLKSA